MHPEVTLQWVEDLRFEGHQGAAVTAIDGEGKDGSTPVGLLLQALGACTAADVVDILRKGRAELRGLTVEVAAQRRERPPRYLKSVALRFRLRGPVSRAKAERAVNLSLETYCSVFHSLRKDLGLDVEIEIEPEA